MVFILPASLITSVEQFAIVTPAEKLYGQSTDIPQSRGGNSGPIFGQSNCPSHTWSITVGLFSYKIPGEPWWNWCWSCPSPTAAVIVQDFDFLSGNKKMEMCSVLFNFFNFFFCIYTLSLCFWRTEPFFSFESQLEATCLTPSFPKVNLPDVQVDPAEAGLQRCLAPCSLPVCRNCLTFPSTPRNQHLTTEGFV